MRYKSSSFPRYCEVVFLCVCLAGLVVFGLSGCSNAPRSHQQCLPVPHYTLQEQYKLAAELEAHCNLETNQCDVPEMERRVSDLWALERENAACLKEAR